MANRNNRDGDFLRDKTGGAYVNLGDVRDKCYAVIVRCGHCGDGYYVPIMFTTKSNSMSNAIEDVKMSPRVKRDKQDCVLWAFEVTELEKFIIDASNDHDPYLKGYVDQESEMMRERRIASYFEDESNVKTAEEYHEFDALGRCFAPRREGQKLIVPNRVYKNELLQEFFKCSTIRFGFKKDNPFFPMLYYLQNGEDNDLGIMLVGDKLSYIFNNEKKYFILDEKLLKYVDRFGIKESKKKQENEFVGKKSIGKKSQLERFNSRFEKFKNTKTLQNSAGESQPGE